MFPPDDKLYQKVEAAYDAMHRLTVEVHYLSCNGVGRLDRSDEQDDADTGGE
jgi:hypothetical protein